MKSQIAFALKCWECNSVDDDACGDNFNHLVDCPPPYESPACVKYKDSGKFFSQL